MLLRPEALLCQGRWGRGAAGGRERGLGRGKEGTGGREGLAMRGWVWSGRQVKGQSELRVLLGIELLCFRRGEGGTAW